MRVAPVSPEVVEVLWSNQQEMNGRAVAACKKKGIVTAGVVDLPEINQSLIEKICRHIMVPDRVWVKPMVAPVDKLVTPDGDEIEKPFFALTRRLGTRWCGNDDDLAFRIGREITSELFFDVMKAEDEATKKNPFRGLIYAPFVLMQLAPIKPGAGPEIGVMTRYSKRLIA